MTRKLVDVSAGVLLRPDGRYLLGQRAQDTVYAGYWEFPGGKLESGESVHQALARELHEELGVQIGASTHWRIVEHVYPHAHVSLHFQIVREWMGEPQGRENQALHWQKLTLNNGVVEAADTQPILPATEPLLADLAQALSMTQSNIPA